MKTIARLHAGQESLVKHLRSEHLHVPFSYEFPQLFLGSCVVHYIVDAVVSGGRSLMRNVSLGGEKNIVVGKLSARKRFT